MTLGSVGAEKANAASLRDRPDLALLTYLRWHVGARIRREFLADLLWSSNTKAARHSLSQALYRVRRFLDPQALQTDAETIRLYGFGIRFDAEEFNGAVKAAQWERALSLYHGPFLAGFELRGAVEFSHWATRVRAELALAYQRAARHRLQEMESAGQWSSIDLLARTYLALEPSDRVVIEMQVRALTLTAGHEVAGKQISAHIRTLQALGDEEAAQWLGRMRQSIARPAEGGCSQSVEQASVPPRFVGRGAELAALRGLWADVVGGDGKRAVIIGEAGVGKSRLAHQFARLVVLQNGRVFMGSCYPAEQRVPYSGAADALKSGFRLGDVADLDRRWLGILADFLPEILADKAASDWSSYADAEWARRRLLEAVAQLLLGISRRRPVLFCVDDAHWADNSTLEFVSYMSRRLAGERVLFLLTVRSEEMLDRADLVDLLVGTSDHRWSRLELMELRSAEVEELLLDFETKNGRPLPTEMKLALVEAVGGRPFYLIETLYELAAHGGEDVARRRPWAFARSLRISDAVQRLATRRLSLLKPLVKGLAYAVATAERQVTTSLLSRVCATDEESVLDGLGVLIERRFLSNSSESISFTHDLLRQAVYASCPEPVRAALHGGIADFLQQTLPETPGVLAHHYYASRQEELAHHYALKAANASARAGAYSDTAYYWQIAINTASSENDRRYTLRMYADWLMATGRLADAVPILESLDPMYEADGHENLISLNYARLALAVADASQPSAVLAERLEHLISRAEVECTPDQLVQILGSLVEAAHDAGKTELVGGLIDTLMSYGRVFGHTRRAADCMRIAARSIAVHGDPSDAIEPAAAACAVAETLDDKSVLIDCLLARATAQLATGALSSAEEDVKAALKMAVEPGFERYLVKANVDYGVILIESGRHDQARLVLEQAMPLANNHERLFILANMAVLGVECGDPTLARKAAHGMLELNARADAYWIKVMVSVVLGLLEFECGDRHAFERRYQVLASAHDRTIRIGDDSYLYMFLARGAASYDLDAALALLDEALQRSCRDTCSRLRIRLEKANLKLRGSSDEAWRLAREVRADAEGIGARSIASRAAAIMSKVVR